MVSITHQLDCTIATDPAATAAGKITPNAWNEAHNIIVTDAFSLLGSSGAGNSAAEYTISQVLDWLNNGTAMPQGAILYRGASGWGFLPPGLALQVLTSGGPAANPLWTTPAAVGFASTTQAGIVLPDGNIITINPATGAITVAHATGAQLGVCAPDGTTLSIANGIMSVIGTTKVPNFLNVTPGDPGGVSGGSPLMLGLGASCVLTPKSSGVVRVEFNGDIQNNTNGSVCRIQIFWGTGTAPSNGGGTTGNAVGSNVEFNPSGNSGNQFPISCSAIIPSLGLNAPVWFDLAVGQNNGTTILKNINFDAYEL